MSFVDSRSLADGELVERDLCIIGSGPAGIAIARAFAGGTSRVALLESGGLRPEDEAQALAEGEVAGLPYPDLSGVRLRAFGGTTWHWGGNIRPLEPLDFEARPWIAGSGWPITAAELAPYYEQAAGFFKLPGEAFDEAVWRQRNGAPWRFRDGTVVSQVFHTVGEPGRNSGEAWRGTLERAGNLELFHHATVVDIQADEAVRRIAEVAAVTQDGKHLRFRAAQFVLAAGGIENPRLLLLASSQQAEGLGNEHDLVGRYFQEHVEQYDAGILTPGDPELRADYYHGSEQDWGETWGVLRLADSEMRRRRLPNLRFQLTHLAAGCEAGKRKPGWTSLSHLLGLTDAGAELGLGRHVANVLSDLHGVAETAYCRMTDSPDYPLGPLGLFLVSEQTPNPESRVRLGARLDRHGRRQALLEWRLQDADVRAGRETLAALAEAFERSGLGRVADKLPAGFLTTEPPSPMFHHMGTTRMHPDPRRGVVDADCRVHRLDNLYLAGSSVFPTCGNANPTYTLVALAIRLADHLKRRMAA